MIGYCLRMVTIKSNKSGNPSKNKILVKDLTEFFNTHFKELVPKEQFEQSYKTARLNNYITINIKTAIDNNIKKHFFNRLFKFIYVTFINDKMTKTEKRELKYQATKIKNDLLNKTKSSDTKYHNWIKKQRNKLLPVLDVHKKSYQYDIKVNPLSYLKYMIYMNNKIKTVDGKQFHCLPLRTNIVPKFIEIDTEYLLETIASKELKKMLCDLGAKKLIWDKYFKTDTNVFKSNKIVKLDNGEKGKYKFKGNIQTDGISICIRLSLCNQKGDKVKYKKSSKLLKTSDNIEFPYMNEVTNTELKKIKDSKKIYVDPGKTNIIYCMDDDGNSLSYSTKQRLKETKRTHNNNIKEHLRIKKGIEKQENKVSLENSKTTDFKEFKRYIYVKNKINNMIMGHYNEEMFRKMNFRTFSETKRSEMKLINNMKQLFGDDSILMYGDKNIGPQMRNVISSTMIGFKRMLKRNFKIYNVDEFRTSCLDYRTTDDNLIKNENATTKYNIKDENGKVIRKETKKLHGVLVSQILKKEPKREFLSYQNRDRNGCLNIKQLVHYELKNGKGERPYWYQRANSIAGHQLDG